MLALKAPTFLLIQFALQGNTRIISLKFIRFLSYDCESLTTLPFRYASY